MPKISKYLSVKKATFSKVGEVLLLRSPVDENGDAAYVIEERLLGPEDVHSVDVAVSIAITKKSAVKLAKTLMDLSRKMK